MACLFYKEHEEDGEGQEEKISLSFISLCSLLFKTKKSPNYFLPQRSRRYAFRFYGASGLGVSLNAKKLMSGLTS